MMISGPVCDFAQFLKLAVFLAQFRMLRSQGSTIGSGPGDIQEVCQWKSFEANCKPDEVIIVTHAKYGRMRLGNCVTEDMGQLPCSSDVLPIVQSACSGRTSCSLNFPDSRFAAYKPCKELTSYLEASYICQKVQTIQDSICHACESVPAQTGSGYIANVITRDTGCGSTDCPWRVSADPGQKIRVTMLDFGYKTKNDPSCRVQAVIKEGTPHDSHTVCSRGNGQTEQVFISKTNDIEIRLLENTAPDDDHYFLLHYETIGCPRFTPPKDATVQIVDGTAFIKCKDTNESWKLACRNNKWTGSHGNCSARMSVAIIVGVAFIICALVVTIGLGCYRLRNSNRPHHHNPPQPTAEDIYHRSLHRAEEIHLTYTSGGMREYNIKEPCIHHHTLERLKDNNCDPRSDLTHIWETPLPHEPPYKTHTLQHHV